jgi:hypothetical protein
MSRTKTFFFIAIISLVMVGCKVTPPVKIEGLEVNKPYLIDSSKELDYPGFMAGAGNIYSCRYGIYYKRSDEFTPTKDIVFSGLLSKYLPNIETHKVELFRFDVFYNKRLKQLQAASYMGGIAGMMAADAAKRGFYGFMTEDLLVDSVPETYPLKTDEISVGCDDHNEGEYFPSRVSGGHDVVVIWLKFEIDEKPYHFRTLYEFQPSTEEAIQNGIGKAIESSIARIASKIEI